MALKIPHTPNLFFVDSVSERNTKWHEGSLCWVSNDSKLYVLDSNSFVEVTGGLGSGSMTTVKEAGVQVGDANIVTLDFGAGFDLTESPDTEINISLDLDEVAGYNKGNWDAAYTHISSDGSDHSFIDQDVTSTASPTFTGLTLGGSVSGITSLDCDEIANLNGDLKIEPDVQGDVVLFGDTQVDNADSGKQLKVFRMAAEGDKYIKFYVDASQRGIIETDGTLKIISSGAQWDNTGNLRLNYTAGGDITCFDGTDVGDAVDGKSFYIYRKAAEGDCNIRLYTDQYQRNIITVAGGNLHLQPDGSRDIEFGASCDSGQNPYFKHYGYITAAGDERGVFWQVNDTDDYFHLTREDSNIKGFEIEMPTVITDGTDTVTIIDDTNNHGMSINTTNGNPALVASDGVNTVTLAGGGNGYAAHFDDGSGEVEIFGSSGSAIYTDGDIRAHAFTDGTYSLTTGSDPWWLDVGLDIEDDLLVWGNIQCNNSISTTDIYIDYYIRDNTYTLTLGADPWELDTGFIATSLGVSVDSGHFTAPSERNASPKTGDIRCDTTNKIIEFYDGSEWQSADCPKIIYASDTLSDGSMDYVSDATNWNTDNAIIKHIKITTNSTDWDLTIYCDSDGTSGMFSSIDLVKNANGNLDIEVDLPYKDNDNSKQVHLKFTDNAGSNTATCLVMGVKAR